VSAGGCLHECCPTRSGRGAVEGCYGGTTLDPGLGTLLGVPKHKAAPRLFSGLGTLLGVPKHKAAPRLFSGLGTLLGVPKHKAAPRLFSGLGTLLGVPSFEVHRPGPGKAAP